MTGGSVRRDLRSQVHGEEGAVGPEYFEYFYAHDGGDRVRIFGELKS